MGIIESFNNGSVALAADPRINKNDLVELNIGDVVEYKTRSLKVVENPVPLSCTGCSIKDFFIGHDNHICDGMACFRAYREDDKNVKLKLCNEKLVHKVTGAGQQQLPL